MSAGVFFEIPVVRPLQVQFAIDIHDFQALEQRAKVLDVSLGLKTSISYPRQMMLLNPGISVGYAQIAEIGFLEKIHLLTVRVYTDVVFRTHFKHSFLFEIVVESVPAGGNRRFDITSNPFIILRFGVKV